MYDINTDYLWVKLWERNLKDAHRRHLLIINLQKYFTRDV
jgi:hypothetical protein